MLERARTLQDQIVAWRREVHKHPELGFQEHRTARLVADTLRAMGLRVETGLGKTGVVGHLGKGRPAVGIRADMDALPLQEANDVPYASQTPGVMHACGHDTHVGILLGVAKLLSEMEDRPAGDIRFLFQPCEETQDDEGKSGAVRMVEEGALASLDAVIALHIASDIPAGKVEIGGGYATAAVDTFYATLVGAGCHGASTTIRKSPRSSARWPKRCWAPTACIPRSRAWAPRISATWPARRRVPCSHSARRSATRAARITAPSLTWTSRPFLLARLCWPRQLAGC